VAHRALVPELEKVTATFSGGPLCLPVSVSCSRVVAGELDVVSTQANGEVTRGSTRAGAVCAIAGTALLAVGTYLHPLDADPNDAVAAFTEYAADHLWVASHLTQLLGVALMVAALSFLGRQLSGAGAAWARLGWGSAIAGLAIAAALQAVDGVALKRMVDAWMTAPPAHRESVFHAAFAVRQIEIGLASMLSLALGATSAVYGVALLLDGTYPRSLGALAVIGGAATVLAGVVLAYSGFSQAAMAINMPASALLLLWMLTLGWYMWRRDPGARQDRHS
jgi:hypothetical protein